MEGRGGRRRLPPTESRNKDFRDDLKDEGKPQSLRYLSSPCCPCFPDRRPPRPPQREQAVRHRPRSHHVDRVVEAGEEHDRHGRPVAEGGGAPQPGGLPAAVEPQEEGRGDVTREEEVLR